MKDQLQKAAVKVLSCWDSDDDVSYETQEEAMEELRATLRAEGDASQPKLITDHPYHGDGIEACQDLNPDGYCGASREQHATFRAQPKKRDASLVRAFTWAELRAFLDARIRDEEEIVEMALNYWPDSDPSVWCRRDDQHQPDPQVGHVDHRIVVTNGRVIAANSR